MSVVNCKVKYLQPKYNNLKEWMQDPDNVYIGRGFIVFIDGVRYPPKPSIFANPFKIDDNNNRESALNKYKIYINDKIAKDPELKEELLKLKGKNLGCWCHPEKCHGDYLLELIDSL